MKLNTRYNRIALALRAISPLAMEGENAATEQTPGAPTPPVKPVKKNKGFKAPAKKAKTAPKKAAKKPAKAKKATGESTAALAEAAKEYQKPKGVKTAAGNQVIDNGDKTAKALRGLKLDEVYKIAARTLKEPESALRAKYKHLNEGMQRMNLGNRIRAA